MLDKIKKLDSFTRSIVVVFTGTTLVNIFNLIYQLLIAHKLSSEDFAAFNSILSIFVIISAPLGTIQLAVAKYTAEFSAREDTLKIKFILSDLFKKTALLSFFSLATIYIFSTPILAKIGVYSSSCGLLLACIVALAWVLPVFVGAAQGLELFDWISSSSALTGVAKLLLAIVFVLLGYKISGALSALLLSNLVTIIILYFPLKNYIKLDYKKEYFIYRDFLIYLIPVALSNFCFMTLVSIDMVLVRYFFSPISSGYYSIAQMLGKIFLFLPAAVSIVMFPKVSILKAKNLDTLSTLKRSILYVSLLCLLAAVVYNIFPSFILKVLTGKSSPEAILLGRIFSVSMSFFTLLFILISYFLSLNDFRFIKYLILSVLLQVLLISVFHNSLIMVQTIVAINSIVIFLTCVFLARKKG